MLILECDGCEKTEKTESTERSTNRIKIVSIHIESIKGDSETTRHLCSDCEDKLRRQSDPRNWPRAVKIENK